MSDNVRDELASALADAGGLEAALSETQTGTEQGGDETPTPNAAGESQPVQGETPAPGSETEGSEGDPVEPPTEYWGTSLEGIPAEKRAEVIAHFEQQDSVIHKLQERLAAPEEPAAAPAPTPEPEEYSDEDVLRGMGFDPDAWETQQQAPQLLAMGRMMLNLETQVESLTQSKQVEETQNVWTSKLDQLEQTYGKLPGTREGVLREAVEKQYVTPEQAYFALAAPVKQEVDRVVSEARKQALKREQAASPRPRGADAGAEPVTPDMSLREAVAASMKSAEQKHKVSFAEAMKAKFSK